MHSTTRLAPFVLLFAAAAAVTIHVIPQEVDEPSPAVTDSTDALLAELARRSAVKRELIGELADGRRTLAEVAARFAAMDVDRPWHTLIMRNYSGATNGERYCRVVIGHTDAALNADPRRRSVLTRLNAELEQVIAAGGRLPDIGGQP
jgi:hypothetical protein